MGCGQFACLRVVHSGTSELAHQSYCEGTGGVWDEHTERIESSRPSSDAEMLQSYRQQGVHNLKCSPLLRELTPIVDCHEHEDVSSIISAEISSEIFKYFLLQTADSVYFPQNVKMSGPPAAYTQASTHCSHDKKTKTKKHTH